MSEVFLDSNKQTLSSETVSLKEVQDILDSHSNTSTVRARTSIAGNRKLASLDPPLTNKSSNEPNSSLKTNPKKTCNIRSSGPMGTTIANNISTPGGNNKSMKSNMRNLRSMSRSEVNLNTISRDTSKLDLISPNPLTTILTDEEMLNFVTQPISPQITLQCTIIRDKKGLDRSLYPTYYMHLQGT